MACLFCANCPKYIASTSPNTFKSVCKLSRELTQLYSFEMYAYIVGRKREKMRILTNRSFVTFSAQKFSAGKIKAVEYGFSKVGKKILSLERVM